MEQPTDLKPVVDGEKEAQPEAAARPYDHNMNPHSAAGISQALARERAARMQDRSSQTPAMGHISLKGEITEPNSGRGYPEE